MIDAGVCTSKLALSNNKKLYNDLPERFPIGTEELDLGKCESLNETAPDRSSLSYLYSLGSLYPLSYLDTYCKSYESHGGLNYGLNQANDADTAKKNVHCLRAALELNLKGLQEVEKRLRYSCQLLSTKPCF